MRFYLAHSLLLYTYFSKQGDKGSYFFQNIILNMNDHGFKVVAFNRTVDKVESFLANEAKGTEVIGATSLQVPGIQTLS